jgi:hypothetical protein
VRLFNSTLYSTIALSLLAGCSGNMATMPSAGVPGAALPSQQTTPGGTITGTITHAIASGQLPSTPQVVTVTVHNAFTLHDANVDVQQFCGEPIEYGPMQPYNQILGYGQASDRPQTGHVSGALPPPCFTGPANNVAVVYNENDYPVLCTLAITPRGAGGYTFRKTSQGPHAKCSLVVTSPYTATFTFNATTPKGELLADFSPTR